MFGDAGTPRAAYETLHAALRPLAGSDLRLRADVLARAFLDQGITFALKGVERPFPMDIIPRIITAAQWRHVESGVAQRVRALEAFLADVYGAGEALRDGIVPNRVVVTSQHFIREAAGVVPANGVRIQIAGVDLIRDERGDFRVLEDNVRTPSGVSYVMENRRFMATVLPEVFAATRIRAVEAYPSMLLNALRAAAPRGVDEPTVVVLTPGRAQLGLLRAHAARPRDGRRAGRRPRPGLHRQRGGDADDRRRAAGGRDLPPDRRRVPRPGALPDRLHARLRRPDQRGAGRQRDDRERARQRRRRRQAALHLCAGSDPVLPRRDAAAGQRGDVTGWTIRAYSSTCSTAWTRWWSSRSTAPAAPAS